MNNMPRKDLIEALTKAAEEFKAHIPLYILLLMTIDELKTND